ncbi:hypothetical protein [Nocardioides speluncae]|uniref:hypothetical protein n=1 Tax=Nocardioides speluncae TaxID=2670337 RepID=UPI000D69D43F|nr:hypothetical protein [Nocardioides speluncae]
MVNVDVMYHHYWFTGEDDVDEPEFGDLGTISAVGGRAVVNTFTESGPISLRVLVGDHAPGVEEESWQSEWERVSEVTLDAPESLQVCSWEYAPSDPPSGDVVRAGRHHLRLHARGEAKVRDDAYVATALEEHLVLVWPADAPSRPAGEGPRWDEVTGVPVVPYSEGEPRSWFGPVKVPAGHFELRWRGSAAAPEPGSEAPALIPGTGVLGVAVGLRGITDVSVEVREHSPGDQTWHADAVVECEIEADRPLRLLDGSGQLPRGVPDPLTTAPGRWGVRLYARHREPDYGQIMLIWPCGAPTRDEADRARFAEDSSYDEHEWGDRDSWSDEIDGPDGY